MNRLKKLLAVVFMVAVCCFGSTDSHANAFSDRWSEIKGLQWEDGRNRIEIQGWTGSRSGRRSRSDDISIVGSIEREFRLNHKLTVGARVIPLFYYRADSNVQDNFPDTDIWGAGFGVTFRYYFKEAQDGFFLETAESVIGQSEEFSGNSASMNFMIELGVGYEFDNNWHVSGRWRHLSNAGLAEHNAGVNAFGLGVGLSF